MKSSTCSHTLLGIIPGVTTAAPILVVASSGHSAGLLRSPAKRTDSDRVRHIPV